VNPKVGRNIFSLIIGVLAIFSIPIRIPIPIPIYCSIGVGVWISIAIGIDFLFLNTVQLDSLGCAVPHVIVRGFERREIFEDDDAIDRCKNGDILCFYAILIKDICGLKNYNSLSTLFFVQFS
jgi:hypothetical protein